MSILFNLFTQNTLLQETYEEWEQCERKLKDIRVWIDKITSNLESIQFKKKPLRDQHGLCEKYLAEINGQKTKITLSIEKLQVIDSVLAVGNAVFSNHVFFFCADYFRSLTV